uniref:Uncharacterized protein n=1 Tax=Salix viminalis TaxID=40686 RepID=A0A6N2NJQ2_SALVM
MLSSFYFFKINVRKQTAKEKEPLKARKKRDKWQQQQATILLFKEPTVAIRGFQSEERSVKCLQLIGGTHIKGAILTLLTLKLDE